MKKNDKPLNRYESTLPKMIDDFDKSNVDLNLTMMAGHAGDSLQRKCPCVFFNDRELQTL